MEFPILSYGQYIEFMYLASLSFPNEIGRKKIYYIKYPLKSNDEVLKEHRDTNKILKKAMAFSKKNKKFFNFYH
jgi:hypothetical protein